MSGLPEGWDLTSTRELFSFVTSGSRDWARYYSSSGALFLRISNLDHHTIELDLAEKKFVAPPKAVEGVRTSVRAGDLLVSITADVGMIGLVRDGIGEAYINQHIALARPVEGLSRRYLAWYLAANEGGQAQLRELQRGATKAGLGLDDIVSVRVPVPPLAEQRRIVAKLDALLARVRASQERLATVPGILKRFRQSVLAAACSGKLTADWRESRFLQQANPMPSWRQIPLRDLLMPGGIFDGPFGSNLKSSDYTASGVRVIRLENVGHLKFISEKQTFVSTRKYEELKRHTVVEGDIIFSSFVDEEVRVCLLPSLETKAIAKADCFCLRPNPCVIDKEYLALQLASRASYDLLVSSVHGATRPRVNTTQLKLLPVAVCDQAEQHEIVRRVQSLFAFADRLETRLRNATQQVDQLTQSILAKAFRGELVPTEAELAKAEGRTYETAEELLNRIRSQHPKPAARKLKRKRA